MWLGNKICIQICIWGALPPEGQIVRLLIHVLGWQIKQTRKWGSWNLPHSLNCSEADLHRYFICSFLLQKTIRAYWSKDRVETYDSFQSHPNSFKDYHYIIIIIIIVIIIIIIMYIYRGHISIENAQGANKKVIKMKKQNRRKLINQKQVPSDVS